MGQGKEAIVCVHMGSPESQSGVVLVASKEGCILMSIEFELWPSACKFLPSLGLPLDGVFSVHRVV